MQEQLDKINEALKNLNEVLDDFNKKVRGDAQLLSNCCGAIVIGELQETKDEGSYSVFEGRCSDCKEYAVFTN